MNKLNGRTARMTIGNRQFLWGTQTYVMGIVNVTPDSFSGDGVGTDPDVATEIALRFQKEGADIIDVGGESTRPAYIYEGSKTVSTEVELSRVIPSIEKMVQVLDIPVSVDTYKPEVAAKALEAGASAVNYVGTHQRDSDMVAVLAGAQVPVVLMHNQLDHQYDEVVKDVIEQLAQLTDCAVKNGVELDNIILDPGIGFGKTPEQNLEIMRHLSEFAVLGQPILVGMSRKSTIGYVLDLPPHDRVEGTAATVALSIASGADMVRVHDVREMVRVSKMADAVVRGWRQN